MFKKFAKAGNFIWVVGVYAGGPPTLEAKIEIADQMEEGNEYECDVTGTVGSAFFGLNDVSRAMMQLAFESQTSPWSLRKKNSTTPWERAFGKRFQSPRRVAKAGVLVTGHRSRGAAPLEELEESIRNRSVFISWKHKENQHRLEFIRAVSIELAKRRFAVWWDRMALTNVEAIKDKKLKQAKNDLMNRLLRQGLSGSTAILGFWTDNYGCRSDGSDDNWTRTEWHARGQRLRFAITANDFENKRRMQEPDKVLRMPLNPQREDAVRVARDFKRAYDLIKGKAL